MHRKIAWDQVVKKVEHLFPYELNYQKPLTQLFGETPEDLQKWELTEGNQFRVKLLWTHYLDLLKYQLGVLDK